MAHKKLNGWQRIGIALLVLGYLTMVVSEWQKPDQMYDADMTHCSKVYRGAMTVTAAAWTEPIRPPWRSMRSATT
jgi:hypothetical protein